MLGCEIEQIVNRLPNRSKQEALVCDTASYVKKRKKKKRRRSIQINIHMTKSDENFDDSIQY